MNNIIKIEAEIKHLKQKKVVGPVEKVFQQSFKDMKLKDKVYFSDTTFVGNTVQIFLDNFRNGENTLLECFKNHPVLYNNYLEVWMILANAQKLLSTPGKRNYGRKGEVCPSL